MRIVLENLEKTYGDQRALAGISLALGPELSALVLIGPSGGGKSTLLRLLGGLETPSEGSVTLDGRRSSADTPDSVLRKYRRRYGYLFQAFNLFPHLTALENLTLPLEKVHGLDRRAAAERATACLERFGLENHAHKRPAQLSGGQQQRVGIARAMAHEPVLLILDEPTSALDPEMTAEVLQLIQQLRESGQEIILSTHEMGFARAVADSVLFLADGRVVEKGEAGPLFEDPQTPEARRFLSKVMHYR